MNEQSDPLEDAVAAGAVTYIDFRDNYAAAAAVANAPLAFDTIDSLLVRAEAAVAADGLLIDPSVLREAVVSLIAGNLVLEGPPGTGKTSLVRVLCEAFEVGEPTIETATSDWSTYDLIGGHETAVTQEGYETIRPRLGIVPRAVLECATAVARHDQMGGGPKAHWLVIDELNRCELDKCFGPLFTVLGNDRMMKFPLWYESDPAKAAVWIPRRFRIIGTLNSIDKRFVFAISQGLTRRFQFVHVGVPAIALIEKEKETVFDQARRWLANAAPDAPEPKLDEAMGAVLKIVMDFASVVRYGELTWPLGTAQLVDVVKRVVLEQARGTDDLMHAADVGLATRVVPSMDQLHHDLLKTFIAEFALGERFAGLVHTKEQLESQLKLGTQY